MTPAQGDQAQVNKQSKQSKRAHAKRRERIGTFHERRARTPTSKQQQQARLPRLLPLPDRKSTCSTHQQALLVLLEASCAAPTTDKRRGPVAFSRATARRRHAQAHHSGTHRVLAVSRCAAAANAPQQRIVLAPERTAQVPQQPLGENSAAQPEQQQPPPPQQQQQ